MLAGIDAAASARLAPVKVNMVVKRGINDRNIVEMPEHFHGTGHIRRFIEYMDVGTTSALRMDDVVPAADILATINQRWPLDLIEANYQGEVATRYCDGAGVAATRAAPATKELCAIAVALWPDSELLDRSGDGGARAISGGCPGADSELV